MAVTAHWIETKKVHPPNGGDPYLALSLQADLIGFHRVPGHHDGEHLAQAFLFIIDRLHIASKVCHYDDHYYLVFILFTDGLDKPRQCIK